MEIKRSYISKGIVYGNCWGGGNVGYASKKLFSHSKQELLELAKEKLEDGSLDSGFGFESLKGALLDIVTIETVEINERLFTHEESEIIFIGNLTADEEQFLENTYISGQ